MEREEKKKNKERAKISSYYSIRIQFDSILDFNGFRQGMCGF